MSLVFRPDRRSHTGELHATYLVDLLTFSRTKFRLFACFDWFMHFLITLLRFSDISSS